jgi:diapolycopene oxygenase
MKPQRIVVIGAGLGGLSAAISLATEGHDVTIVEKNDKPGGKLNVAEEQGFRFDLGPSILTMPHIFRALFERAGKSMSDYVEFQELKTHWRNFFEDGLVLDLCSDLREQEIELGKLPAGGADGFFEFLEYSRRLCQITEQGYFAKGLDSFAELVKFYGLGRSFAGFDALRSLDGGVRRFVKEPHLIDILNYFIKYVGSSPYDSPALLNLLPYVQFGYGLWYVKGGMHALARALERLLLDLGGRVRYRSEIVGIDRQESRLTAVRTAGGEPLPADIVVANMEVVPFYEKVTREPASFLARYTKFAPSCSGLVLHLGVDRHYPQLAHHNVFYSRNARLHFDSIFKKRILSADPTIYLVAPCKTDPALAPPGCEIIKVLPHIPHLKDAEPFSAAEYAAFRDRVLAKLERMGLTDLRRHIVVEKMWTPHDIEQLYYSNRGSIYGVVSDRWKNLGFKAPQRSERYRNLYFVGGSVNPGGGMPMVTLSGQLVRDKIQQDLAAAAGSLQR